MTPVERAGTSVVGVSALGASVRRAAGVVAGVIALAVLIAPATAAAGVAPIGTDGKIPTLAPLLKSVTPAVVNIAVLTASGGPQT